MIVIYSAKRCFQRRERLQNSLWPLVCSSVPAITGPDDFSHVAWICIYTILRLAGTEIVTHYRCQTARSAKMAITHSIISFLALAHHTLASNGRSCTDFTVPVEVHANNTVYDIPRVDNNIDAVDFIRNIVVWSAPNSTSRIRGPRPVNQKFNISARLCVPLHGAKAGILQVATHGFGFDKR
jgi:hypothetical protein